MERERGEYVRRVIIAAGIVAALGVLLLLLWYAANVLFLFFGALLLAILLRGLADLVSHYTPLSKNWGLTVVLLLLLLLVVGTGWLIAPSVATQADRFVEQVPKAIQQAEQSLKQYEWGRRLIEEVPGTDQLLSSERTSVPNQARNVLVAIGSAIGNVLILLALAIYLAAQPDLYQKGLIKLVPPGRRERAREVLQTLGHMLQRWLLGRLAAMTMVGLSVGIGLWLLGVPMALMLGLIAGLLDFVPYIGPILGFIPGLLVAFMQSPLTGLYVAVLYLVVQQLENFLVEPIVEAIAVRLPPVLTIAAQILMGVIFGVPGLIVATPLAAVLLALVKMLYIEDLLGEHVDIFGEEEGAETKRAEGRRAGAEG